MIKTIIFDCSDTLLSFELTKATAEWLGGDEAEAKRIHTISYGHPSFVRYCLGTFDYETAKKYMLEDIDDADKEICERHVDQRADHYSVIDGIPELLKTLKSNGYTLYILSDFPDHFETLSNRFDFFKLFDGFCVSYEAHETKTNGRLFEVAIDRYSLNPSECVFIDDTYRNVKMSELYGMNGITFTSTEDTIARLKGLGVNV